MCGRYTLTDPQAVLEELGVRAPFALAPRFNVAPTDEMPVVRVKDGERIAELERWGLIPSWAESPAVGARMINARAESAARKPAFRDALARRRCLVPTDGFFEWKRQGKRKLPQWIRPVGGGGLWLAGLWERWRDRSSKDAPWLLSFTILTGPASPLVAPIHDRMPILVAPEDRDRWLAPELGAEAVADILTAPPGSDLEMIAVSERVNSVRNDDPDCLRPAAQGDLFE